MPKKNEIARVLVRFDGSIRSLIVDMVSGSRFSALLIPERGGDATEDEIDDAMNAITDKLRGK